MWPHGVFRELRGLFGPLGPGLSLGVLVGSSRNRVFCPTSTTTTVTVITRLDLISDGSSPSSAGVGEWSVCVYKNMPDSQGSWIRPYQPQSTGSHPNTEVNVVWACSVLGWGTTREQCGVESIFVFHPVVLKTPFCFVFFFVFVVLLLSLGWFFVVCFPRCDALSTVNVTIDGANLASR